MTTSGQGGGQGGASVGFTMFARDRLTGQFTKMGNAAVSTGSKVGMLSKALMGVVSSTVLLQTALIGLGPLLAVVVGAKTVTGFLQFEAASRKARFQLILFGASARDAQASVDSLGKTVDRATAVSILGSASAMDAWSVAGDAMAMPLAALAEDLSKIVGLDPGVIFSALVDAVTTGNFDTFLSLVGGMERLGEAIPVIESGDTAAALQKLIDITNDIPVDNVSALADSLQRIADLTLPTREAFTDFTAGILLVLTETLAEKLENQKENLGAVLATALGASVTFAGPSIASKLSTAIVAGLATALVIDLSGTFEDLADNKEVIVAVGIAAASFGVALRSKMITAVIAGLGAELAPGIGTQLEKMSIGTKIGTAVGLAGGAIGRALGMKIGQSIFLGFAISKIISDLATDVNAGNAGEGTVSLAITVLGAVLGLALGRSPMAAIAGAMIASELATTLIDMAKNDKSSLAISIGLMGASLGAIVGIRMAAEAATQFAKNLTTGAISSAFVTSAAALGLLLGKAIAIAIGVGLILALQAAIAYAMYWSIKKVIDAIEVPDILGPGWSGTMDNFYDMFKNPLQHWNNDEDMGGYDGWGSSNVNSSNSQPIAITLMVDKTTLGEVVVDIINKEARLKSGLSSSALA